MIEAKYIQTCDICHKDVCWIKPNDELYNIVCFECKPKQKVSEEMRLGIIKQND